MQVNETIGIIKQVLMDARVYIVIVVLLLYLSIVNYVIRYRKKPPKVRKVHIVKKPEPENTEQASSENGETSSGESSATE